MLPNQSRQKVSKRAAPVVCSAAETAQRLPYPGLSDTIDQVLKDRREGIIQCPERLHLSLEGGTFLVMPIVDPEIAVVKLVTVIPDNPRRNLDTVQGEVAVFSARTGQLVGRLDGPTVTERRTAALSLSAARRFSRLSKTKTLLLIGAGVQARAHLEAFHEGLGIDRVWISSRTGKSARTLADYGRSLGLQAEAVDDISAALDEATLIVTATTSRQPVLTAPVRPGVFIAAVGAYLPEMAEIGADLVRASRIIVDTLAGARAEAGDLIQSGILWDQVEELSAVRPESEFSTKGTVLFKSVGSALWDLAAAKLAFKQELS